MEGYQVAQSVPADYERAARQAVAEAAALLDIPVPRLFWWKHPEPGKGFYGWTFRDKPGEIHLNLAAIKNLDELRAVIFHECRHAWQDLTSRFLQPDRGEDDANEFAYKHTHYLLSTPAGWQSVRAAWRD